MIESNSRFQFHSFPQKVPFCDDCARLARQRDHFFPRGQSRCGFLYPERYGQAHHGRYAPQKSDNRRPAAGQFFWRRLSGRAISADVHGEINWVLQYHSLAEGEHASHAQARPAIRSLAKCISAFSSYSSRGRPGRSILQFQRKATGPGSVVVWANNKGIKAGESPEGEPGNSSGDGWYHPRKGK
jgi:hypothetical protein